MGTKPLDEGRGRQTSLSSLWSVHLSVSPSFLLFRRNVFSRQLYRRSGKRTMRLIRCALQHSDWLLVAKETCVAVYVPGGEEEGRGCEIRRGRGLDINRRDWLIG